MLLTDKGISGCAFQCANGGFLSSPVELLDTRYYTDGIINILPIHSALHSLPRIKFGLSTSSILVAPHLALVGRSKFLSSSRHIPPINALDRHTYLMLWLRLTVGGRLAHITGCLGLSVHPLLSYSNYSGIFSFWASWFCNYLLGHQ